MRRYSRVINARPLNRQKINGEYGNLAGQRQ
jgi:hypothetical protein